MLRIIKYGFYGMILSFFMIKALDYLFFIRVTDDFVIAAVVVSSIICGCTARVLNVLDLNYIVTNDTTENSNDV